MLQVSTESRGLKRFVAFILKFYNFPDSTPFGPITAPINIYYC